MKKYLLIISLLALSGLAKAQTIWTEETKLKGTIGKNDIFMTLAVPYGGATPCFIIGKYQYASTQLEINLCSEDDVVIVERYNNKETGYFILGEWKKSIGQTVTGTWSSMDGRRKYPVRLRVVGKGQY
jgi:hypothetical protein